MKMLAMSYLETAIHSASQRPISVMVKYAQQRKPDVIKLKMNSLCLPVCPVAVHANGQLPLYLGMYLGANRRMKF